MEKKKVLKKFNYKKLLKDIFASLGLFLIFSVTLQTLKILINPGVIGQSLQSGDPIVAGQVVVLIFVWYLVYRSVIYFKNRKSGYFQD